MWGRTITLTRLAGFDIKIDASWFLIAALIIWSLATGYFPAVSPAASLASHVVAATFSMLGLFASLVLHELAHSIVARRYGLSIAGITLFLFGGVAELEREPSHPEVEFHVAIVGPMASFGLAALFGSSLLVAQLLGMGPLALAVLGYLTLINLVLALFNLLPALPLDGGRVYRAWLWQRTGDLWEATQRAASLSVVVAWGMIGLGGLATISGGLQAGLWPILVGLFLLAMSKATLRQAEIKHLMGGRQVRDLMTRMPVVIRPDQSLAEVVERVFLSEGISFAPVVENGILLGYVDLPLIRRIERENWATTRVDDVVEGVSDEITISADASVAQLLEQIGRTGQRKLMVVDGRDLKGVVTLSDVMGYLEISRQLAQSD